MADFQPSVLIQLELTIGSEGIMLSVKNISPEGWRFDVTLQRKRKLCPHHKNSFTVAKKLFFAMRKSNNAF